MPRSLLSWGRQLIESAALIPTFVTFSRVIQWDTANNVFKSALLGVLWTTSIQSSLEQSEIKVEDEKRLTRAVRVGEPAFKALVVTYAISLDILMEVVSEERHPQLLYPAFGAFTLILGRRALVAFQKGDSWSGVMTGIASVVNVIAAVGVAVASEKLTMVALLVGAGGCTGLFAKQVRDYMNEPKGKDLEYFPLNSLNPSGS